MKENNGYSNLTVDGDTIQIYVDDVIVTGTIIQRHKRSIGVEITDPYSGISESSGSIPLLGLQFHNYEGKEGDQRAAAILCDLYSFCLYAEAHRERLLAALADYRFKRIYAKHFSAEAVELQQRINESLQKYLDLREELKAGSIDNLEYQRRVGPLAKEIKHLGHESEVDLDAIFDECFCRFRDTALWELNRETVITYLERMRNSGAEDADE
ncbi:MAG TPA: hypothetical protein PKI63_06220 [Candidatus Cloacimonadota bacterium]|nr:hypothetical protein [Candidatus Cloacimonadota bacterium]